MLLGRFGDFYRSDFVYSGILEEISMRKRPSEISDGLFIMAGLKHIA